MKERPHGTFLKYVHPAPTPGAHVGRLSIALELLKDAPGMILMGTPQWELLLCSLSSIGQLHFPAASDIPGPQCHGPSLGKLFSSMWVSSPLILPLPCLSSSPAHLLSAEFGKHLLEVEDLLQKHKLMEADIAIQGDREGHHHSHPAVC